MPKEFRKGGVLNTNLWRYLVNFWTIILYAVILSDFFNKNSQVEFLGPVSAIYIATLALYTAQKEFERWNDHHVGVHPGEKYVYVWTALVVIMLALELIDKGTYKLPSEVFTTYIVVIGILAITKKSKTTYSTSK